MNKRQFTHLGFKIVLHLLNAQGGLTKYASIICNVAQKAEKRAHEDLGINWPIDLAISASVPDDTDIDEIDGDTQNQSLILLNIGKSTKITETRLYQALCHELYHAAQEGYHPDDGCEILFDDLIHEGFAILYEQSVSPHLSRTIIKQIAETQERNFVELLEQLPPLDTRYGDYDAWAIFGDGREEGYGRWSGYYVGYYLARQYLKKTGKTVVEALYDGAEKYRKVLKVGT